MTLCRSDSTALRESSTWLTVTLRCRRRSLEPVMAMWEPVVRFLHRPVLIVEPVVRCRLRMGRRPKRFQLPMERNRAPRMGENEAFNQIRAGMMADFVDNQHMSQEDAEQAFQEAVASGEVDDSVQAYMSQNNQSPTENVTAQPEMNANQPVYNTETGEIVGETLPSGTMDAAVSSASTWQKATDNATPMPESVNNSLQQAYMRENPVQQSPEEHLRMAQEEWTRTTGLPSDMMPASAECAMNPNGIQPSRKFTVDSGRTQQQGSVQAQAPRQQSQPQPQAQVRQQPSVRIQPPTTPSPTVKQPVDANPSNLSRFPLRRQSSHEETADRRTADTQTAVHEVTSV